MILWMGYVSYNYSYAFVESRAGRNDFGFKKFEIKNLHGTLNIQCMLVLRLAF